MHWASSFKCISLPAESPWNDFQRSSIAKHHDTDLDFAPFGEGALCIEKAETANHTMALKSKEIAVLLQGEKGGGGAMCAAVHLQFGAFFLGKSQTRMFQSTP
jgi:hypothetical protein